MKERADAPDSLFGGGGGGGDGETIELNLVVELEKPQASAARGDWTCQNYGLGKIKVVEHMEFYGVLCFFVLR